MNPMVNDQNIKKTGAAINNSQPTNTIQAEVGYIMCPSGRNSGRVGPRRSKKKESSNKKSEAISNLPRSNSLAESETWSETIEEGGQIPRRTHGG